MAFRSEKGFFGKMAEKLGQVLMDRPEVDEEMLDEIEEVLITSDIGMDTTIKIVDELRTKIGRDYLRTPEQVKEGLKEIMIRLVDKGERNELSKESPLIVLMVGINGGGKTTTIGKLAYKLKKEGRSVVLAAADTFRAAAGEQLKIWGERNGVRVSCIYSLAYCR